MDLIQLEKEAKASSKIFAQILKKANQQKIIKLLPKLHQATFHEVNCLKCANCCKNYSPRFKMPDIKRIAKYLHMKESKFIETYLKIDEDEDYILQQHPCSFLDDQNYCTIYDVRPRDCYRYPYTDEDVLVKQPKLTLKNAEICPAVFTMLHKINALI